MRIKQVGIKDTKLSEKKFSANQKIIVFVICFILIGIGVTINFYLSNEISKEDISEEIKKLEFDLKEKEFELNQRETEYSNQKIINELEKFITLWIEETNNKSITIEKYYADYVEYYTWGFTSKSKLLEDKFYFYKKWDNCLISTDNIQIEEVNQNKYNCYYDKYVECENYSNGKKFNAKLKSFLALENFNGNWKITIEKDPETYYLNKNW